MQPEGDDKMRRRYPGAWLKPPAANDGDECCVRTYSRDKAGLGWPPSRGKCAFHGRGFRDGFLHARNMARARSPDCANDESSTAAARRPLPRFSKLPRKPSSNPAGPVVAFAARLHAPDTLADDWL